MLTLHLIDPSTPRDGMELLAEEIAQAPQEHAVLVLGHAKFMRAAMRCGVPGDLMRQVHCMGWADVSTWMAVRRMVTRMKPAKIWAWGVNGVAASCAAGGFAGERRAIFSGPLSDSQLSTLRLAQRFCNWKWTATSGTIQAEMIRAGLRDVEVMPAERRTTQPQVQPEILRKQLGLLPDDGPIILLGGEHTRAARHDLGLWAAGIFTQLHPKLRVIVRSEDEWSARGVSAARYFSCKLPRRERGDRLVAFAAPELSWRTLLSVADVMLVTADGGIATGSILQAQAVGVPVIATDVPCMREIMPEEKMLAVARSPRSIAARLEAFFAFESTAI